MLTGRQAAVVRFEQGERFANLCRVLREPSRASRLSKPLYYWALSSDRHLPSALLNWTLEVFLATPFESLCATPGVGPKKIGRVLELLERAARDEMLSPSANGSSRDSKPRRAADEREEGSFAPDSELAWDECRRWVLRCGLGNETLGRFVPSLRELPRRIWHSRLSTYAELSLAEIRELPSFGPKRERAVLETFGRLYDVLRHLSSHPHLHLRLEPRQVALVEDWVQRQVRAKGAPSDNDTQSSFIEPLCEQVRNDADERIASLLDNRLAHPRQPLQIIARRMGVARSWIYEALGHVASIIDVRWPGGRTLVQQLTERMESEAGETPAKRCFLTAVNLFFPANVQPFDVSGDLNGRGL